LKPAANLLFLEALSGLRVPEAPDDTALKGLFIA
jgi:hypothetical protein